MANNLRRVAGVRERYALELKHLGRRKGGRGFVTSGLTRISDWSPLTAEERTSGRAGSPFALCRGVPSGLSSEVATSSEAGLDFAVVVSVPRRFCRLAHCSSTASR